jgi:hypothetical protein
MSSSPRRLPGCWLLVFFGLAEVMCAQETVTVNFPLNGASITAPGLSAPARQITTPDGLGYVELALRPMHGAPHVFLTIVFDEDGGKGPALFWSGDVSGEQRTLSEDLAEGVVGLNHRSIELPDEVASEAGRLYIVGRQDRLVRVRLDWSEPVTFFVAADQEQPRFVQGGALKLSRDLGGAKALTPPDAWFGQVLDAALQDGVADLSETTELVVPIKGVVSEARLRAKFLGLALGRAVRVWVNGKFVGRMQPETPSLTDPGYVRHGNRAVYAGWREGAIFLESTELREGENSIIFESPGKGVYMSGAAMEIQNVVVEVPPEVPAATATPAPSATPDATPIPAASPAPAATEPPAQEVTPVF